MPHYRSLDWPTYRLDNLHLRDELGLRSLIEDALSTSIVPTRPTSESSTLFVRLPRPQISLETDLPWLPVVGIRPPTRPDVDFSPAVPEPTAALCFAVGLAAVAQRLKRRRA